MARSPRIRLPKATFHLQPLNSLTAAIVSGDAKRFQAVPGIGKRTAERIILELKDRVTAEAEESGTELPGPEAGSARSLARDWLVNLGYPPLEAEQLLDGLPADEDPESLISAALRRAGTAGRGTGA